MNREVISSLSSEGLGERLPISRRRFFRTLLTGGAAVLASCDARVSQEKEIPNVILDDLIKDPSLYSELSLFRTVGYPEKIGEEDITYPIFGDIPQWITKKEEIYVLHTDKSLNSPGFEFTVSAVSFYPLAPHDPSTDELSLEKFEIIGKLSRIKDSDKSEKYVIIPDSIERVEVNN